MTGTVLQLRGGTATESDAFTGQTREITVDVTNKRLRVHDGTTPGGTPLATLADAKQAGVIWGGTASGTANAYTIAPSPAVSALIAGQRFAFVLPSGNTITAPTLAVSGLTAAAIKNAAGNALVVGQLVAGSVVDVVYDGAAFRLVADAAHADDYAPGFKNRLINSGFLVNNRIYVSGNSLSAGVYGHDRWKAGSGGASYTFTQSGAPSTQITITAGSLVQVIEGTNLESGTYALNWQGTSQVKINGGTASSSPQTFTVTGGSNVTIEFTVGTLLEPMLNRGARPLPWEVRAAFQEVILCQRYCRRLTTPNIVAMGPASPGVVQVPVQLDPPMRGTPTLTTVTTPTLTACTSFTPSSPTANGFGISLTMTGPAGQWGMNGDGVILVAAEL